jgi:ABC-type antimicrobial peptide transport system permease subunit
MSLAVRAAGRSEPVLASLRQAVRGLHPQAPVTEVRRMAELRRATTTRQRGAGAALGLFGLLALVLAAVGLYGVLAFVVGERTREFGVRLALGARPSDILGQVLGRGAALVGAGLAGGLAGAFVLGRVLASLLYGMTARDPATFATVVAVLAGVALAAGYLPARRAARVDPATALRTE